MKPLNHYLLFYIYFFSIILLKSSFDIYFKKYYVKNEPTLTTNQYCITSVIFIFSLILLLFLSFFTLYNDYEKYKYFIIIIFIILISALVSIIYLYYRLYNKKLLKKDIDINENIEYKILESNLSDETITKDILKYYSSFRFYIYIIIIYIILYIISNNISINISNIISNNKSTNELHYNK